MADGIGLSATMKANFSWTASKTVQGSEGKFSEVDAQTVTLTAGKGSGKADVIFRVEDATIDSGAGVVSYDLLVSLKDLFGGDADFVKLKGVFIKNTSDKQTSPTTAKLIIGGNANSVGLFSVKTTTHTIDAGGFYCTGGPVGVAVAGGTDVLDINNADGNGTVRYSLTLIGEIA